LLTAAIFAKSLNYRKPGGAHVAAHDFPSKAPWPVLHHRCAGDDDAQGKRIATMKALIANPPLLLFVEVLGLAGGLAMIIGHNIWSGGALPVVITLIGWLMALRGAGLLALSPAATTKLFEALRYEQLFYFYMGGTLILGLYLALAGFSA
jgi:hypothetical protein